MKRYITLFLNKLFAKAPETIVRGNREIPDIGLTIIKRVAMLAAENGETVEYGIYNIKRQCKSPYFVIDAILLYGKITCDANTFAAVLSTAAEYYNTSTDFLLGLTDRP